MIRFLTLLNTFFSILFLSACGNELSQNLNSVQTESSESDAELGNDWCSVRHKYNDGVCDHCPKWDSDCPSPDAWGRTSQEQSSVKTDSPSVTTSGLIRPLRVRELQIPSPRINSAHKVMFVGDSNMGNTYLDPSYRMHTIPLVDADYRISSVFARIKGLSYTQKHDFYDAYGPVEVINLGIGGANTQYFLQHFPSQKSEYVVICLGLNERRMFPVGTALQPILNKFRENTLRLVRKFQANNMVVILMTNVFQDAERGHQSSYFGDNVITSFDNVYREMSRSQGIPLIDVNMRMRSLAERGQWDFRRRRRGMTSILDNRFDAREVNNFRWFGDVHYNRLGTLVVAREIARRLNIQ